MFAGIVVAVGSAFLFALGNVLIRTGQRHRSGDTGAFMTMFVNMVVLVPMVAIAYRQGDGPAIHAAGVLVFIAGGLLSTFLGRYANLAAIRHIGPARAVSIKYTFPVVSTILATIFLNEVLHTGMLAGMALVMSGAYLTVADVARRQAASVGGSALAAAGDRRMPTGVLLATVSSLAFGTGNIVRKAGLLMIPSPLLGAATGATVACLSAFLVEVAQGKGQAALRSNFQNASRHYVLAGLSMSGALLLTFLALARVPVGLATVLFAVEPVLTVLLAALILRNEERITRPVIGSMALTLGGIALIVLT